MFVDYDRLRPLGGARVRRHPQFVDVLEDDVVQESTAVVTVQANTAPEQESAEELGERETLGEGSDHFPMDLEFALLEDSTYKAVIGHMKMKSSSKKTLGYNINM